MSPQNSSIAGEIGVFLSAGELRHQMQQRGWQIKQLAAASGISGATIRRILRGYPCFGTTLDAIRKAFEDNPPRQDRLVRGSA